MIKSDLLQKLWTNRQYRDRLIVTLLGVFWAVFLIAIQAWTPLTFLRTWELKSIDQRFRWRGPQPPAPEVVLVGIDEDSFAADIFSKEELTANPELRLLSSWPWPRRAHALALEKLLKAGARVVAFDLLFSTPSKYGEEDDAALRVSLEKARGHVVIGANQTQLDDPAHGTAGRGKWMMPTGSVVPDSFPLLELCAAVNYEADIDLVMRRISPRWHTTEENQLIDSFSVRASTLYTPQAKWAFDHSDILINYPGPGSGSASVFARYPFYTLFYGKSWERNLRNGEVFKNKIVLVGPTQNFLHDVHPTPFGDETPGVAIHASAVSTLLQHNELHRVPYELGIWLVFLFAAVGVASLVLLHHPLIKLMPPLLLAGAYVVACQLLFEHVLLVLPLATPIAVLVPVTLTGLSWQLLAEQFERRRARAALERQVSKEVADELMKEYGALQLLLAPQERHVVVFFSDIRNFTTIFEQGDPKVLIGILNEYLSAMSLIVTQFGGTLDKYIGDAIMAFWGAPTSQGPATDALRAVKAALQMRKELEKLRTSWATKNYPEIKIGIGIHAGTALVGEVGSQQRSEYTAIGDTVNTASRIEGVNKETKTDLLVSDTVYALVKDHVNARPVGERALKGKAGHVMLYFVEGLVGETGAPTPATTGKAG